MKEKIKVPKLFDEDFKMPNNLWLGGPMNLTRKTFGLPPVNEEERIIFEVSRDGNWVEILGHRIDGFDSFEKFIDYLKGIVAIEEENVALRAQKAALTAYLEERIEESVFMRTRDVATGQEFLSTQETVYRDILDKVKGE